MLGCVNGKDCQCTRCFIIYVHRPWNLVQGTILHEPIIGMAGTIEEAARLTSAFCDRMGIRSVVDVENDAYAWYGALFPLGEHLEIDDMATQSSQLPQLPFMPYRLAIAFFGHRYLSPVLSKSVAPVRIGTTLEGHDFKIDGFLKTDRRRPFEYNWERVNIATGHSLNSTIKGASRFDFEVRARINPDIYNRQLERVSKQDTHLQPEWAKILQSDIELNGISLSIGMRLGNLDKSSFLLHVGNNMETSLLVSQECGATFCGLSDDRIEVLNAVNFCREKRIPRAMPLVIDINEVSHFMPATHLVCRLQGNTATNHAFLQAAILDTESIEFVITDVKDILCNELGDPVGGFRLTVCAPKFCIFTRSNVQRVEPRAYHPIFTWPFHVHRFDERIRLKILQIYAQQLSESTFVPRRHVLRDFYHPYEEDAMPSVVLSRAKKFMIQGTQSTPIATFVVSTIHNN